MTSTDMIVGSLPHKSQAERARMRANAERLADKGIPTQKTDAERLLDALAALTEAEAKTLYDRLSGLTVAARVVEAFRKQPPTETDEKVIMALLRHPGSTSEALSKICGWRGQIWHTHFGKMCGARETWLWPATRSEKTDTKFLCGILAEYDWATSGWTMKPDVAAAFAELGLVARQADKPAVTD